MKDPEITTKRHMSDLKLFESLLPKGDPFYMLEIWPQKSPMARNAIRWLLQFFLITLSFSFGLYSSFWLHNTQAQCVRQLSWASPVLGSAGPYIEVEFNGTLDAPSRFKGYGPDVDVAWQEMHQNGKIGPFGLSEEDFIKLDQPDNDIARLTQWQGGGYYSTLEVHHQLHCLNLIREYTYPAYYTNHSISFTESPEILRMHVDHCIDMLRQKLMCDADVGVVTYHWVAQRHTPWANFNTWHKCRNWDNILEWSEEHNALDYGEGHMRPPDVKGLETPP